jgi:hypothetical protein
MSRAGRKRKQDLPRKAGRIDWRQTREEPAIATKWHRGRDNFLAFGGDQFLASQAGKMFVFKELTALEMEAAKRWSEMLVTQRREIVGMSGEMHGSMLFRAAAGVSLRRDPDWIAEFNERFEAARDAILQAGKPALSALNRLCRDEASSSVLLEAKRALAQLVVHFRLDATSNR